MYTYRGYVIKRKTDTRWRVIAPNGEDRGCWTSEDTARARVDVCIRNDSMREDPQELSEGDSLTICFPPDANGFWIYTTITNP